MPMNYSYPDYEISRNEKRCIACRVCERQCANGVHSYDPEEKLMVSDETKCVNCHRCVCLCPTKALKIVKTDHTFRENANWSGQAIKEIYLQAGSGGVLLSSMGNPNPFPVYWDKMLINASQVTNPPIDPLREPMETKVFLGKKPVKIERAADGSIADNLPPQMELQLPIMFSAMSYGSISYNAHESLAGRRRRWGRFTIREKADCTKIFTNTGKIRSSRSLRGVLACIKPIWKPAPQLKSRWDRVRSRESAGICRVRKSWGTFPKRV